MECYHCATIHPELTEVLPEFADGYAAQYFVGHGAEFGEDVKGFTVDGSEGLDRHPGRRPRTRTAATTRSPIRPQVFVNLVPDHVIFHRMYPMAADHTDRRVRLALPARTWSRAARTSAASVELFHRVNRQDFDACERCQPAMSSRVYAEGGVLVPSEHHIGEFHDWVHAQRRAAHALDRSGRSAQVAHPVADLLRAVDQPPERARASAPRSSR